MIGLNDQQNENRPDHMKLKSSKTAETYPHASKHQMKKIKSSVVEPSKIQRNNVHNTSRHGYITTILINTSYRQIKDRKTTDNLILKQKPNNESQRALTILIDIV